jgi:hypothetical protein
MKNIFLSFFVLMLLFYGLSTLAQVSINADSDAPDSSAMLDIGSSERGLLLPRMTLQQRDAISNPAIGLMIFQTDGSVGFFYFNGTNWLPVSSPLNGGHYPGELFGGGVVFWTDATGEHGLIVSMVDISSSQAWSNITATPIGVSARSDWNGLGNSNAIVNQSGHTMSAAKLCLDYTNANYGTGVFSDWYLPARAELNHFWTHFYEVQKTLESDGNPATVKIATDNYWSSTEESDGSSWYYYFTNGGTAAVNKHNMQLVRAVREF